MNNHETNSLRIIQESNLTFYISHDFKKNRFLESDNLDSLKREDGSITKTHLFTKLSYRFNEYVVLSSEEENQNNHLITMKIHKKNDRITYLPVENYETITAIAKKMGKITSFAPSKPHKEEPPLSEVVKHITIVNRPNPSRSNLE